MTIAPRTLRPLKVSQPACYNIFAPKGDQAIALIRRIVKDQGKPPSSLPCTGKRRQASSWREVKNSIISKKDKPLAVVFSQKENIAIFGEKCLFDTHVLSQCEGRKKLRRGIQGSPHT